MVLAETPADATLYEVLRLRAVRATQRQLLVYCILGLLSIATAMFARPRGWLVILCVGAGAAAYGVWALAERRVASHEAEGMALALLLVLRVVAAIIGIGAGVLLPFVIAGIQLAATANT
jgi:hypothetical protein